MGGLPLWTTHLLAFAVGVATWLPFTLWEGRRVTCPPDKESRVPTPEKRRLRLTLIVCILICSLLLVGFGVQQGIYQHRQEQQHKRDRQRDLCVEAYNREVDRVRTVRIGATDRLGKAQKAKDAASDDVLLTTLDLLVHPPPKPNAGRNDLTHALIVFSRKKAKLDKVDAATSKTERQNQFPDLNC
jgi:alpha-N-acetylglucosamine transferase